MNRRIAGLVLLALGGAWVLLHAIRRDIRYMYEDPGDLRNRVVGARLVKDGRDPYFYKWTKSDGIRYYDPQNFQDMAASCTTVSPFVLHLMAPIADLPEGEIIPYWFLLHYLVFAGIILVALFAADTPIRKQWVLALAGLFLLSDGWKAELNLGQYYLLIPLGAALFYACLRARASLFTALLAGLFAAALVLVRPLTLFFFLPFLLLLRNYSRNWWIVFCIPGLVLATWILFNGHERALWQSYSAMLDEYVHSMQHLPYRHVVPEPDPNYRQWEGMDHVYERRMWAQEPDKFGGEFSNVFIICSHLFGGYPSVAVLTAVFLVVSATLGFVYFRVHRPFDTTASPAQIAIFAWCLYVLAELFSPTLRRDYFEIQWAFVLPLVAATAGPGKRVILYTLLAAMLLQIVRLPHVKMQNTLGDYLIVGILLVLCLVPKGDEAPKPLPTSILSDQTAYGPDRRDSPKRT